LELPFYKCLFSLEPGFLQRMERNFVSASAVAIICGKVSLNLEVIDIDSKYDHNGTLTKDFFTLVEDNLPDIGNKLVISNLKSANKKFGLKSNDF